MQALPSSRRFKIVLACSLLVSVALLLGSCGTGVAQHSTATDATTVPLVGYHPDKTVTYGASWAGSAHDLQSLKRDADLSVEGTITKVSGVTTDQGGIVFTDFVLAVTTTLLDPGRRVKSANTTIIIHQTGGMVGSTLFQMEDDPLFQVGEQAILFLHEYSPGYYFVLSGPVGRFVVRNGLVSPINDEGIALDAPLSVAAFITKVQQA